MIAGLDQVRLELQDAIVKPGLPPSARIAKLRILRERLVDLVGETDAYLGDLELVREAEYLEYSSDLRDVRENATIRDEMLRRGFATEDELDGMGYVSHVQLDELREEGRLMEAVGTIRKFMERLHPRDRAGKFSDKPGPIHLAPKGRMGRGTPKVIYTHDQEVDKRRRARVKDEIAKAKPTRSTMTRKKKGKKGESKPKRVEVWQGEDGKWRSKSQKGRSTSSTGFETEALAQQAALDADGAKRDGMRSEQRPWKPVLDKPVVPDLYGADSIEWHTKGGMQREPTMDEIMADLEMARRIGLNDWPEKDEIASQLLGDARDTEEAYTQVAPGDPYGRRVWSAEREALHDQIINLLLKRRDLDENGRPAIINPDNDELQPNPGPDGRPRVLFMGGGTASGKTTAQDLEENRDVAPPDSVLIDPDEIKGMLPEYNDMIENGSRYAATGSHEESSYLAKRLQREAMSRGLNVVVDGTSDSLIDESKPDSKVKMTDKLTMFKNFRSESVPEGYEVTMFYVSAPTDLAVIRATIRAMRTGRWVPEKEIRTIHRGVSDRFEREIMPLIEQGGVIDRIFGYDTTEKQPQRMFHLDEDGKFVVLHEELFTAFLAKAKDSPGDEDNSTDLRQLF